MTIFGVGVNRVIFVVRAMRQQAGLGIGKVIFNRKNLQGGRKTRKIRRRKEKRKAMRSKILLCK